MVMALTQFQSNIQELNLLQTSWANKLNPLLDKPLNNSLLIPGVVLSVGDNVINHRLGRKLQGWMLVDINGAATIYRAAPKNNLTLTLNSSAAVTVDLVVF
jgi:hypothetical protein